MSRDTKVITILLHRIEYWYDNEQDMPEHEEEHVKKMIIEGYFSGELNDERDTDTGLVENGGWWKIENNPDN